MTNNIGGIFSKFHIQKSDNANSNKQQQKLNSENSTDVYLKNDDNNKNTSKRNIIKWAGAVAACIAGGFGLVKLIKSGRISKIFKNNIQPQVTDAFQEFVSSMKPKDENLAKEFFEILERNANNFGIKRTDYNDILGLINSQNKTFIKNEAFPLLEQYNKKIKELLPSKESIMDILPVINEKNKSLFPKFMSNPQYYKIDDFGDVTTYLKAIKPENQTFIMDEIFPMLLNDKLKINSLSIAEIFETVTPKTKNSLASIINYADKLGEKNIKINSIFRNVNENNCDAVKPLLDNMEKLGITNKAGNSFKTYLSIIDNNKVSVIEPFANSIIGLNDIKIDKEAVLKLLTPQNAKILPIITSNPKMYQLRILSNPTDIFDVEQYLTRINPNKIEMLHEKIMPKLYDYHNKFTSGSYSSDMIIDEISNLSADTASAIDILTKYKDKIVKIENNSLDTISHAVLPHINNTNVNNLDYILNNFEHLPIEYWTTDSGKMLKEILNLPLAELQKLVNK